MTEPGPEEQQRLEEGVGHHEEDGRLVGAGAHGQEHVAELRHRRVGQHLLDVLLGAADGGGHEGGGGPDRRHHQLGVVRQGQQRADAAHQVDAGGDHGGGVDEGRHRGGALHGVGQPREQRELGRLARGGHEQQQADGRARAAADERTGGEKMPGVVERARLREDEEDGDEEAHVGQPVVEEGLLARRWRRCRARTRTTTSQ